jgi:type II secretory pathway predicted ATPase ExeA
MYLNHFGLNEPPFRITPHTEFFFSGANRGATLDALLYAITHDEGIVKVSGEVGSGKTMLCRVLMERLPKTVAIVYLANPSLSRDDILYAIADELNLKLAEGLRSSTVIRALQEHLIQLYSQGRRVVVLVDEAHAMPAETLEEIRLLSNLESNKHKLLQLVLFGQPELNEILARPNMRQLKERITHNFQLEPLVRDDVAEYLEFRLRAAGYKGPNVFSPQATRLISDASLGLTRRINILADKTLLACFSDNTHQITAKHVRAAIKDCEFSAATLPGRPRPAPLVRPLLAGTIALLLIASTYFLARPGKEVTPQAATPAPQQQASASTNPPAPVVAPSPAPAPTNGAAPIQAVPVTPPAASTPAPPTTLVAAPSASAQAPAGPTTPLVDTALQSGKQWLTTASSSRWFVQLYAVPANQSTLAETFLREARDAGMDMTQTRAYLSDLSGHLRYGIVYGDFETQNDARKAIEQFPPSIRARHPFIRPIKQLR